MNTEITPSNTQPTVPAIDAYIISEDYTKEDVGFFPGEYDWDFEKGPFFEDVVIEVTAKAFREACVRLQPLLETFPVDRITVAVDIYDIGDNLPIEIFNTSLKKEGDQSVNLVLYPYLLMDLLAAHFDQTKKLSWEKVQHFDNILITAFSYRANPIPPLPMESVNPLTYFVAVLAGLKEVGLGKLGFYLNPENQQEPTAAETDFTSYLQELLVNKAKGEDLLDETRNFVQKIKSPMHKLLPKLLLHGIYVGAKTVKDGATAGLAEKAFQGNKLSVSERCQIMEAALKLDTEEFILSFRKPGLSEEATKIGKSFYEVLEILQADHRINGAYYASVVAEAGREYAEILIQSFHDCNKDLSEQQRIPESTLNLELNAIHHDEQDLLDLAQKISLTPLT